MPKSFCLTPFRTFFLQTFRVVKEAYCHSLTTVLRTTMISESKICELFIYDSGSGGSQVMMICLVRISMRMTVIWSQPQQSPSVICFETGSAFSLALVVIGPKAKLHSSRPTMHICRKIDCLFGILLSSSLFLVLLVLEYQWNGFGHKL